jgi:hypothetical protein
LYCFGTAGDQLNPAGDKPLTAQHIAWNTPGSTTTDANLGNMGGLGGELAGTGIGQNAAATTAAGNDGQGGVTGGLRDSGLGGAMGTLGGMGTGTGVTGGHTAGVGEEEHKGLKDKVADVLPGRNLLG